MTYDLVLTGGFVVTPEGKGRWDLGIREGRVAAIGAPGSLVNEASDTRSIVDKVVVPGGIDPHVHCGALVEEAQGGTFFRTGSSADVSRAALWGGTTTLIDFAWRESQEDISQTLKRYLAKWNNGCYCDYSFHITLRGELAAPLLSQIPDTIRAGYPSFKVFTTDVFPPPRAPVGRVPYGSIKELLRWTADHNGIVAVHAEDDDMVMHMYRKLIGEGRTGLENMPNVHSALSERVAIERVLTLAEHERGCIYLMHVSAGEGVEAISGARSRGVAVYGETLPQYVLTTQDAYRADDGVKFHTYPSLKSQLDVNSLWRGVRDGSISTFATDEMWTPYATKLAGTRIDNAVGGHTGVETRLALVYTEVVDRQRLGVEKFVQLTSTNAAKILGLYPQKGVIAVGSDADLAILEPNLDITLASRDLHESDYSPWEGYSVSVRPVMTLLRGKIVVEGGRFKGEASDGRPVYRKLAQSVPAGTASS